MNVRQVDSLAREHTAYLIQKGGESDYQGVSEVAVHGSVKVMIPLSTVLIDDSWYQDQSARHQVSEHEIDFCFGQLDACTCCAKH